jgi:centromere/kinetochore protein ZW10
LNCVFQAVPNEASKLIEFQGVVRSTTEFENTLRSMMFISPDGRDGKLTKFVNDVEVHFAVRKRSEILVKARDILVRYDYKNPLVSTKIYVCRQKMT